MTAASVILADLPPQPAPNPAGPGAYPGVYTLPMLVAVVLKVIARAKELAATLHQAAAHPGFAEAARSFGSTDPAVIMISLRRGLMRANALYAMLLRRQARGLDLPMPRLPAASLPRAPKQQDKSAAPPRARWWQDCGPSYLPTQAEVDDEVIRREPGKVLASICLDLSIHWRNADPLWYELYHPIVFCGGNLCELMLRFDDRFGELPEALRRKPQRRDKRGAGPAPGEAASAALGAAASRTPAAPAPQAPAPQAQAPATAFPKQQPAAHPVPQPLWAEAPPAAIPQPGRPFRAMLLATVSTLQRPEPPVFLPESPAAGPP